MNLCDFEEYLRQCGLSDNSVASYTGNLRRYQKWIKQTFGSDLEVLYRVNVLEFKQYLLNVAKLSDKSVNAYLSALRKYNGFLLESGIGENGVIRKADYRKISLPFANPWDGEEDEVEALRQAVLSSKRKYAKRNFALVTLLAKAGLRVSEAISVKLTDFCLESGELRVVNGKGDKSRTVIINDKIVNAIREYLRCRGESSSDYLFVSRQNDRLTRSRVNQIIKAHSTTITPHTLRHYFCSQAQNAGGYSTMETALMAGHADPRTTMLYSHANKKQLREKANLI
jgi:site-specific recombinase XerD